RHPDLAGDSASFRWWTRIDLSIQFRDERDAAIAGSVKVEGISHRAPVLRKSAYFVRGSFSFHIRAVFTSIAAAPRRPLPFSRNRLRCAFGSAVLSASPPLTDNHKSARASSVPCAVR